MCEWQKLVLTKISTNNEIQVMFSPVVFFKHDSLPISKEKIGLPLQKFISRKFTVFVFTKTSI